MSESDRGVPRLGPVEVRILGVLVEKQMTTPDTYPLTLAGVVAGSNQSTNRDPVMAVSEEQAEQVLVSLHDMGLATPVRRSGDRATKYRHKLGEFFEIDQPAQAVLAVLMLRGAQTSGELRARTERYVQMATIDEVEAVIDRLEEADLVKRLPRAPGQSQRRVSHLLASEESSSSTPTTALEPAETTEPLERPSTDVERLAERVSELERRFEKLLGELGVEDL